MNNINLKEIKKLYPTGSMFLTATKKIKQPLKVTEIKYAEHLERENQIKNLQNKVITLYNEYCGAFATKYLEVRFNNRHFILDNKIVTTLKEEIEYLQSLPKDIINSDGGVIYDGETDNWAEVVTLND